jgi:branched-chain amino acid transport system ATP-binding protein
MGALLECRSLTAGHGRVAAIRNVEVTVEAGRVMAIVGPNGAGKTTLLATIAGLLPPLEGTMVMDGTALKAGQPAAANRAGVVLVPDDRALFTTLTTAQNIELARKRSSRPARAMLEHFPALEARWKVKAGQLSGGEQQMLAMARALIQDPKVLLVDEMSMGLAPIIIETLLPIVRRVADEDGAAVVLVEQHVALALEVADDVMVLSHGEVVLQAPASKLAGRPDILEAAYLGGTGDEQPKVLKEFIGA